MISPDGKRYARCPWCGKEYQRKRRHNRARCKKVHQEKRLCTQEDMMGKNSPSPAAPGQRPDPAGSPGNRPGGSEDDGQRDAPAPERAPGKGDERLPPGR